MTTRDPNADHFIAAVSVDIIPVNKYNDELDGGGTIRYKISLKGSLLDIVAKLEKLKEPAVRGG